MKGGGGGGSDGSAEIRAQEAERQARIREGKTKIDEMFDGGLLTDDFYDQRSRGFLDYYMPQLNEQAADARDKLILQLARQGILSGSAGAKKMGDFEQSFQRQRANIADQAVQAKNDAEAKAEKSRADLYAMNASAADPSIAAQSAMAAVQGLQVPEAYSPLGNVFADFLDQARYAVAAENQGMPGWGLKEAGVKLFGGSGGGGYGSSGSARIVPGG